MATTYSVDGKSFGSIGEAEDYLSGQGYDKYTIEDNRQGGIGRQTGVGMGEGADLLGVAGDGGGGKTSMGYGYTDPKTGQWVPASRDMVDGGGPGRSGDTFQGGPFSGILNALGVRPAGYRQRLEDNLAPQTSLRPQARPEGFAGMAAALAAAKQKKQNASDKNTSAAQGFSVMPYMPYQIGITPPAAVAPSAMSVSPVAPPSPALFPGFSNYGAGQSLRYEPDMGRMYYGYLNDPAGDIDLLPFADTSYYDPTGGRYQPTWLNERTGVSPLNLEPQPRRSFGDHVNDLYNLISGR